MTVWSELREALSRLSAEQPDALRASPSLDQDEADRPYCIELAAWASAAAGDLHRRFGDEVHLTVGALPYPPGRPPRRPKGPPREPDPLLARDRSGAGLAIATSGQVTGSVIDPATGGVVGGSAAPSGLTCGLPLARPLWLP